MKLQRTERGFAIKQFQDSNNIECTIQKSSSAMEDKIWLGAKEIGLKKLSGGGWQEIDTTSTDTYSYIANNRMHLNCKQAKRLIKELQYFVDNGDLKP
jgi:hypothetical protein